TSGAHTSLRRINLPNGNTAQGGITKQYDYRRAEPISPAGNGAPKGNAVTLRRTLGRCPLYNVTGRNARTKSGGVSPTNANTYAWFGSGRCLTCVPPVLAKITSSACAKPRSKRNSPWRH